MPIRDSAQASSGRASSGAASSVPGNSAPAVTVSGAMRVHVNDVLADKYLLTELLGSGGMGYVFRGEWVMLHVPVAVKVLYLFHGLGNEQERRFQREARASMLLNHPNIVRVLDYGYHDDSAFIVMEYVAGRALDDWMAELMVRGSGLPTLQDVSRIMEQLLSAIDAAHTLGIVHRDIKPANILITTGTEGSIAVKVVDFGLAHVEDKDDIGPTLTLQDVIAGTPAYMSPEQCRSLAVGPSTDLYAAGCVLTFLLQGSPPFEAKSPMDLMAKQMFLAPEPLTRPQDAEDVPPLLERFRMDLLAKQASSRPQSASAAVEMLRLAMSKDANNERVPQRKQDSLFGPRDERAAWLDSPRNAAFETPAMSLLTIAVVVLRIHPDGWSESNHTGLAAHGISVESVSEQLDAKVRGDIVVVDAADDIEGAIAVVQASGGRPVIVCACRFETEGLNRLIEAGASEVLRYPVSPDALARRVQRVGKRRRR